MPSVSGMLSSPTRPVAVSTAHSVRRSRSSAAGFSAEEEKAGRTAKAMAQSKARRTDRRWWRRLSSCFVLLIPEALLDVKMNRKELKKQDFLNDFFPTIRH